MSAQPAEDSHCLYGATRYNRSVIYLLYGENDFLVRQKLAAAQQQFVGGVETYDGAELAREQLPGLFGGMTLFDEQRLIIIRGLSEQKSLWNELSTWLEQASNTTEIYLVEPGIDKRTKTYKWLQRNATVIECAALKASQTVQGEAWLRDYAARLQLQLDRQTIESMVARAIRPGSDGKPIIDQQLLTQAVTQLALHDGEVTTGLLDAILPPSHYQNVFGLLAATLDGSSERTRQMTQDLRTSDDGYKVLAVLSSQIAQLSLVIIAGDDHARELAHDSGVHPYVLQQLQGYRKQLSLEQVRQLVELAANLDYKSKRSSNDPWLLVDSLLAQIVSIQKHPV